MGTQERCLTEMVCEDGALYKCPHLCGRVCLCLCIRIEEEMERSFGVLEFEVHLSREISAQATSDLRGFRQIAQLWILNIPTRIPYYFLFHALSLCNHGAFSTWGNWGTEQWNCLLMVEIGLGSSLGGLAICHGLPCSALTRRAFQPGGLKVMAYVVFVSQGSGEG